MLSPLSEKKKSFTPSSDSLKGSSSKPLQNVPRCKQGTYKRRVSSYLTLSPDAASEVTRMNHDGWIYTVHMTHFWFVPLSSHISNSGSDGVQLDLRLYSMWKWCDSRPTHSPSLLPIQLIFWRHFVSSLIFQLVWGCFSTCSLSRSDSGNLEVNIASVILQVEAGELAFELTSENVGAKYCGLSILLPFNKVLTSSQLLFNGYFLF